MKLGSSSDMIITKEPPHLPQDGDAGPSTEPPPPFADVEEENTHLLAGFPSNDPPPPDFAPYDAEFFLVSDGNVVSHDPHLNTDGEALYRFLLSQSLQPPHYQLHCRGTHQETRARSVMRRHTNNRTTTDTECYTETITDFDFYIDIFPSLPTSSSSFNNNSCGPIHWSVSDSEPAYRGRMVRELEPPFSGGKRTVKRFERKEYDAWGSARSAQGLPPWISSALALADQAQGVNDSTTLKSSKTLRQWADEYCASPKHLKEFTYKKVLYGWNIQQLEVAVRAIITSTPYNGSLDVSFKIKDSKVYVRPNNRLSRMLSNKWLKFLSIILFIFPFIWLFKRFHSRGGGRWEVCGGAYSLKREAREEGPAMIGKGKKVIGVREGEWFRKWEGVIRRSVLGRYVSTIPIAVSGTEEDHMNLVGYLDGYRPGYIPGSDVISY